MDSYKSALERAFELAASGEFERVDEIRRRMRWEGYVTEQVVGRALSQQLNTIMRARQQLAPSGTLSSVGR